MRHEQFAKMSFTNGESMFVNTMFVTGYGYLKDRNETVVSVLGEGREIYFPGDQTSKIQDAFNWIDAERR